MQANKNASFLRALLAEADALSCHAARNEFPVLLRSVAQRRKVTSVMFRPLLVDAMLTTHSEGFRMFFNSNGANSLELKTLYEDESRERPMDSRFRFSLAHEIAHTLFYDISDGRPQLAKQFRSGGGRTALENLERNCNKLAARLLMPTPMLKAAFQRMKSLTPKSLTDLAFRAGVSIEALVRRISEDNSLLLDYYFRGSIILARAIGNEITVAAVARPAELNIARDLRRMRSGERWQLAESGGREINPAHLPPISQATLTVETPQASLKRPYQILVAEAGHLNSGNSFLLTFEELRNS
jgi:hypothetical protein